MYFLNDFQKEHYEACMETRKKQTPFTHERAKAMCDRMKG